MNFDSSSKPDDTEIGSGTDYSADYSIDYVDNGLTEDNSQPDPYSLPLLQTQESLHSDSIGDQLLHDCIVSQISLQVRTMREV